MGRISGWAAGKQWKLRTQNGVRDLVGAGSGAANTIALNNQATIVRVDATPAEAELELPLVGSGNLDTTFSIVRQSGANDILVRARATNSIVGAPGGITLAGAVGSAVTFISDGQSSWVVESFTEIP